MKNKYKISNVVVCGILLLFVLSCSMKINPPTSMRFSAEITILDTTMSTRDSLVSGAQVTMQSITYEQRYISETGADGIAFFNNLIPDRYNIIASGKRVNASGVVIINGQLQNTSLYIENNDTLKLDIIAQTSSTQALVISEIYYSGAKSIIPTYYHDQFVELYNQSNETVYLDSIIIANVEDINTDTAYFESGHVRMFPGSGNDYPVEPGQFIVSAQDAIDHSPYPVKSVDLSHADFEHYCTDIGDVDNDEVTNTIEIHKRNPGADVLYSTLNDAIVLLKIKNPYQWGYTDSDVPYIYLPKSAIFEGVDYRENTTEYDRKHLSETVDGGITGGIPRYSSKSVERYIDHIDDNGKIIFMDNNNSSLDFHVLRSPTPGYTEEASE